MVPAQPHESCVRKQQRHVQNRRKKRRYINGMFADGDDSLLKHIASPLQRVRVQVALGCNANTGKVRTKMWAEKRRVLD
jgi:hypothetical protein